MEMDLSQKLIDGGWHLTDEGIKKLSSAANSCEIRKIIDLALNSDFREIAGGALPAKRDEYIPGNIVLQIQKIRNISAPKSNEESKTAPRLLQIDFSDGQSTIQVLELEPLPALNLNLAPGTKVILRKGTFKLLHGFIVLQPMDIQVLGGRVESLYEKWEVARAMQKYARSGRRIVGNGSSVPPPWIPFGKKSIDNDESRESDRNFKSLAAALDKDKELKDNTEFLAMRNEAIAVANKTGSKKVFGGGGQILVDHNVKKILDKGYSEDEAKNALRATNNNLERALYNLKRRMEKRSDKDNVITDRNSYSVKPYGGRRGASSIKDELEATKPAGNVSLFDFLTKKLPDTEKITGPHVKNTRATSIGKQNVNINLDTPRDRARFENNISSSFAANRSTSEVNRDSGSDGRSKGGTDSQKIKSGNTESFRQADSLATSTELKGKRNSDHRKSSRDLNNVTEQRRRDEINENARRNSVNQRNRGNLDNRQTGERHNNYYSQRTEARHSHQNCNSRVETQFSNSKPSAKSNRDTTKNIDKLVESTSNMKIDNKPTEDVRGRKAKQQAHRKTDSSVQYQHTVVNTQRHTLASNNLSSQNLSTSSTYDPSKIIGFQSKETNEFAMSLLKSQGMTAAQPLTGTSNYMSGTVMVSGTLHPVGQQLRYSDGWAWKIGDLCLAKYWDDGQYYEAEITAISEKTFVVLFLGYGNHEEVLKNDCLPITDGNHQALNNRQGAPQLQAVENSYSRGTNGNPQRYRDRQVYVPPHKRDN